MFNHDFFLPVWPCTGHPSCVSTPASEPLNPLWRVSAWVSDCRMNLIQFYRESTISFLWRLIDIVLFSHLKLNLCSIFIPITFFSDTLPPSLRCHITKTAEKTKLGPRSGHFYFFFWRHIGRKVPVTLRQPLPLAQDGWLYQPLQAGGAQINPVLAETGLRNPHERYAFTEMYVSWLLHGEFSPAFYI